MEQPTAARKPAADETAAEPIDEAAAEAAAEATDEAAEDEPAAVLGGGAVARKPAPAPEQPDDKKLPGL